jgi:hypothetical protein
MAEQILDKMISINLISTLNLLFPNRRWITQITVKTITAIDKIVSSKI